MVNEHELREHLSAYIAREISLASLERWMRSAYPQLVVDADDSSFRLLASVNLLVSERHDEIISADELRDSFVSLLNKMHVVVAMGHAKEPHWVGHSAASADSRPSVVVSSGPAMKKVAGASLAPRMQLIPVWVR